MLCNRIKQFRVYNNIETDCIAEFLDISTELYNDFEEGKETPTIDIIEKLAACYKVTVDELYGYSPRVTLYNKPSSSDNDDFVEDIILKMSDLSWEEAQLVLYFRSLEEKDDIISEIIKRNMDNKK